MAPGKKRQVTIAALVAAGIVVGQSLSEGSRLPGGLIICSDPETCAHELEHDERIREYTGDEGIIKELDWYRRYLTDEEFRRLEQELAGP